MCPAPVPGSGARLRCEAPMSFGSYAGELMARNPSAMKRHGQDEKRRLDNRARKSTIRTFTKKAVAAAESGDFDAAAKYQKVVQGLVDKAIMSSTLHKNSAARKKSRLSQRINALREQAQAA